jgi:hypothetical protein
MNETERLRQEVEELRKDQEVLNIRVYLAHEWLRFYQWAYDVLLAYGVNFKSVKEYQDDAVLEEAMDMPISKARNRIVEYLRRLKSGTRAAARRKNFTVH